MKKFVFLLLLSLVLLAGSLYPVLAMTSTSENTSAVLLPQIPSSQTNQTKIGEFGSGTWLGFSCGEGYRYQTSFSIEDALGQLFEIKVVWHKSFLPGVRTGNTRLAFQMSTEESGEYLHITGAGEPLWGLTQWENRSTMISRFYGGIEAFRNNFYSLGMPGKFLALHTRLEKDVELQRNPGLEAPCMVPFQPRP